MIFTGTKHLESIEGHLRFFSAQCDLSKILKIELKF